jgi:putative Holliday junction resolvase
MTTQVTTVMALDIGEKRTGVALAHTDIAIPKPFKTLEGGKSLPEQVAQLVTDEGVVAMVIGLPRNLSGEKTDQTRYIEVQAAQIKRAVTIPVYFVDEALTSLKAEAELRGRGREYSKAEVDMLAATFILEDFINEHPEFRRG